MFQFPRFAHWPYVFRPASLPIPAKGFPHSDISGSKVACHLPEAFRRLLRPSSPHCTKASTVRPCAATMARLLPFSHCCESATVVIIRPQQRSVTGSTNLLTYKRCTFVTTFFTCICNCQRSCHLLQGRESEEDSALSLWRKRKSRFWRDYTARIVNEWYGLAALGLGHYVLVTHARWGEKRSFTSKSKYNQDSGGCQGRLRYGLWCGGEYGWKVDRERVMQGFMTRLHSVVFAVRWVQRIKKRDFFNATH